MAAFIVVYDACVLYPAPLRDLLMHLALSGLLRARWTNEIHDEWTRNVLANRPDLKPAQLERTRTLMNSAVPECLVTGYEPLIETLALPDPDDLHVLAAGLKSGASIIVTYNLGDFPTSVLSPHGIEALHPDAFLTRLLDLDETAVCAAARRQRQSLKNPPKTVEEYLAILAQQRLPNTVARLRLLAEWL